VFGTEQLVEHYSGTIAIFILYIFKEKFMERLGTKRDRNLEASV